MTDHYLYYTGISKTGIKTRNDLENDLDKIINKHNAELISTEENKQLTSYQTKNLYEIENEGGILIATSTKRNLKLHQMNSNNQIEQTYYANGIVTIFGFDKNNKVKSELKNELTKLLDIYHINRK